MLQRKEKEDAWEEEEAGPPEQPGDDDNEEAERDIEIEEEGKVSDQRSITRSYRLEAEADQNYIVTND